MTASAATGDPSHPGDWAAPTVRRPVEATVALPGSKSLTNRFLVLAALAGDWSRLRQPLRSRDTLLMAAGLEALGVEIEDVPAEGHHGSGMPVPEGSAGADWVVRPPAELSGGVLLAAVDTAGKPGIAWRAQNLANRSQREAKHAIGTAGREARLARKSAQIKVKDARG